MVKAVLRNGTIVPTEPLPPEWQDGTSLEIARSNAPVLNIDQWADLMNQLCADSAPGDEEAMRRAMEEQRRQAKAQTRRDMGLPT